MDKFILCDAVTKTVVPPSGLGRWYPGGLVRYSGDLVAHKDMARESALGIYKSMLPSYSAPSLFDVRRAARVVIGFEFIIHDLRYLLQLYLVIVIQCYCVSHPPPHTTPDVLYSF